MATGSSAHGRLLRMLPGVAVIAAVAVALRLIFDPWYLNYDARFALVWARDAVHGSTPEYTGDFAPTPHPLETAVSALALPFGGGEAVMGWLVLLCFGALAWVVYRLGSELFTRGAGVVAAIVVLTRPRLLRDALLGYQDVAFALLIVGAVLLEVRQPRRGTPVLALLVLAGLMRPEAWVLLAAYALYLWPRRVSHRERLILLAVVALPPGLWALSDFLVTGDAFHSLHGTSALAEAVGRRRDVAEAPYWTVKYFGSTLREPLALGIPIGLAFATTQLRGGRWVLPIAVASLMVLVFMAGPVFGLPLIGRYLRTPAILLALFYGIAVMGWRLVPDGKARRRWLLIGVFAAALSIVYVPIHARMVSGVYARIDRDGRFWGDLKSLAESAPARAVLDRCGPIATADHRPIPYLRFWLEGPPGSVVTVEQGVSPMGDALLVPRRTYLPRRFYSAAFPGVRAPAAWRTVAKNRSWRLVSSRSCDAGVP